MKKNIRSVTAKVNQVIHLKSKEGKVFLRVALDEENLVIIDRGKRVSICYRDDAWIEFGYVWDATSARRLDEKEVE